MKKFFKTLLIFVAIFCFSFVFTACGEDPLDKNSTPGETETTQTGDHGDNTGENDNTGNNTNTGDNTGDNTGNNTNTGDNTGSNGNTNQASDVTLADVNTAIEWLGDNFTVSLSLTLPEMLSSMINGMAEVELPSAITGLTLKTNGEVILLSANIPDVFEGEIYIVDGQIFMREKEDGEWGEFDGEQPGFVEVFSFSDISLADLDIAEIIETLQDFGITVETSANETSLTVTLKLADKVEQLQNLINVALDESSTIGEIIDEALTLVNYDYDEETYDKAVDAFVANLKSFITETTIVSELIDYIATEFKFSPDLVNTLIDAGMSMMNQQADREVYETDISEHIYFINEHDDEEEQEGFDFASMKDVPVLALLSSFGGVEFSADPASEQYFGPVIDVVMNFSIQNIMTMMDGGAEENAENEDNQNTESAGDDSAPFNTDWLNDEENDENENNQNNEPSGDSFSTHGNYEDFWLSDLVDADDGVYGYDDFQKINGWNSDQYDNVAGGNGSVDILSSNDDECGENSSNVVVEENGENYFYDIFPPIAQTGSNMDQYDTVLEFNNIDLSSSVDEYDNGFDLGNDVMTDDIYGDNMINWNDLWGDVWNPYDNNEGNEGLVDDEHAWEVVQPNSEESSEEDEGMMSKILPILQMLANVNVTKFDLAFVITLNENALGSIEIGLDLQAEMPSEDSQGAVATTDASATMGITASAKFEFSAIGSTTIDTTDVEAFIEDNAEETVELTTVTFDVDVAELDYEEDYEIVIFDDLLGSYIDEAFETLFEEDENATFIVKGVCNVWDDDLQEFVEQEFDALTLNKDSIIIDKELVDDLIANTYFDAVVIEIEDAGICVVINLTGEIPQEQVD